MWVVSLQAKAKAKLQLVAYFKDKSTEKRTWKFTYRFSS